MSEQVVAVEQDGAVAHILLDRPPVNAVTAELYRQLIAVIDEIGANHDVRAVVVRSTLEKAFCAGADMKEVSTVLADADEGADEERQRLARTSFFKLADLPQPTIAVLNGHILGTGVGIAGSCDIRIGTADMRLGLPEIKVARCGGGRHLMRLLPQGLVRQMFFTGNPIDGETARHFGLVQSVYPDLKAATAAASELAAEIANKSPLALRLAKQALNEIEMMPLKEGYRHEQTFTVRLGRSNDAKEATAAFLERRPPQFTGT